MFDKFKNLRFELPLMIKTPGGYCFFGGEVLLIRGKGLSVHIYIYINLSTWTLGSPKHLRFQVLRLRWRQGLGRESEEPVGRNPPAEATLTSQSPPFLQEAFRFRQAESGTSPE